MKLRYYEDTDTLVLVFSEAPSTESAEIAKNVVVDLDAADQVVAMEIEHASTFVSADELRSGRLQLESIRKT
jgi:uncharacterized protein YuzE